MNREQLVRSFRQIDLNFKNLDQHVGGQLKQIVSLGKSVDKVYLDQLTINMMVDCLLKLLEKKGVLLSGQFAEAMKELAEETAKQMQEEAQKKAEASATPPPAPAPVA